MPAYTIEVLSERDYDALVDLWSAAELSYRPAGRDARDAIALQMRLPQCRFFGVRGEVGELTGAAIANHEGRKGWINRIAVRPGSRRDGVARALVDACEKWLHTQKIEIVAALVEGWNESSQAFFGACGYDRDDTLVYFRKVKKPEV